MHSKGVVKIVVDGRDRFLKVGTLSSAIFCDIQKIKSTEIEECLNTDPFAMINFVFAGAVAYCRLNKIEVDFTPDEVSVWIDIMGDPTAIIMESMKTYDEKKVLTKKAPAKRIKR